MVSRCQSILPNTRRLIKNLLVMLMWLAKQCPGLRIFFVVLFEHFVKSAKMVGAIHFNHAVGSAIVIAVGARLLVLFGMMILPILNELGLRFSPCGPTAWT